MLNFYFRTSLFFIILFLSFSTHGATLKGYVIDSDTHKTIPGAIVSIVGTKIKFETGENGYYIFPNLEKGSYILSAKMLGYKFSVTEKIELKSKASVITYDIYKRPDVNELENINVNANIVETEFISRQDEKLASNIVNIISAKSIELLPDLNLANVMQRVSGISMLKNSSGNNTEVIIRGMPPRYNSTLINGTSAAGTSSSFSSVPLNIIPSNLVGRVTVIKALTPDMEGNGLGGTVNVEMRKVPETAQFSFNLSGGYNQFFEKNELSTSNTSGVNMKDPAESNLNQFPDYTYIANSSDFTRENMLVKSEIAIPKNMNGNFLFAERFFKNKFGILISATIDNNSEGSASTFVNANPNQYNSLDIISRNKKVFVSQSMIIGSNLALNYEFNKFNKISVNNSFFYLTEKKVRIQTDTITESNEEKIYIQNVSNKHINSLNNTNIEGQHQILKNLIFDWKLLYSISGSSSPDLITENFVQTLQPNILPVYLIDSSCVSRVWQHNTNNILTKYFNFKYKTVIFNHFFDFKFGGMASVKYHTNYAKEYSFNRPAINYGNPDMSTVELIQNVNNELEINNPGKFNASENIEAGYVQIKTGFGKLQILTGVRVEFTNQRNNQNGTMNSYSYKDVLPSLHLNYLIKENQNMRLSAYNAISRPNFTELVDFYYQTTNGGIQGNKDLKHSTGTSFDARYELYPNKEDLITIGVFYKYIKNPIEDLFGINNVVTPTNGPNCVNYGFELVGIKYLGDFGLNVNYTYTKSKIETSKVYFPSNSGAPIYISENRPLVNQSPHIFNAAFIYRNIKHGVKFQLVYTMQGENVKNTSTNYGLDVYQKNFHDLGATFETRTFSNKLSLYIKASNILNSKLNYCTKSGINVMEIATYANYLIGIKFKL